MFPFSYRRNRIMGINARNGDYVYRYNQRRHYPLADDKIATKRLAQRAGVPTPKLYGTIDFQAQVATFHERAGRPDAFVVKPARGSGGGGIIVVVESLDAGFRKGSGLILGRDDLVFHLQNILSGMYSLSGNSDRALLEYPVSFDPIFDDIAYQGVPDVRIVALLGVPVMAMLRLPTRAYVAKANLHTGGIGVGIDMGTGKTLGGVQYDRFIDNHPETGGTLVGRQIPHWREMMVMAAKFFEITELGYLGVDIVLDKDKGPMLLEINARPGISIQIANREGILGRLQQVERDVGELDGAEAKVDYSRRMFAVY
ncbi:MAG: alpha-L-glutamate ligase-like protein [Candidatus Competibacterales bacterium]